MDASSEDYIIICLASVSTGNLYSGSESVYHMAAENGSKHKCQSQFQAEAAVQSLTPFQTTPPRMLPYGPNRVPPTTLLKTSSGSHLGGSEAGTFVPELLPGTWHTALTACTAYLRPRTPARVPGHRIPLEPLKVRCAPRTQSR